jgi:hypothetical protein
MKTRWSVDQPENRVEDAPDEGINPMSRLMTWLLIGCIGCIAVYCVVLWFVSIGAHRCSSQATWSN